MEKNGVLKSLTTSEFDNNVHALRLKISLEEMTEIVGIFYIYRL